MNSRARRLVLPLGGAVAVSAMIGATMAGTASAAPLPKGKADALPMAASSTDAAKVVNWWTANKGANLVNAKYFDNDAELKKGQFGKTGKITGTPGGGGSVPPIGGENSKPSAAAKHVNLPYSVGKVYFEIKGQPYWCSASSVQSKYRNLVATAGHCAYDTDENAAADFWMFVPSSWDATKIEDWFEDGKGKAPFGFYVGRMLNMHPDYDVFEDYDRDYAFVNVYNGTVPVHGYILKTDESPGGVSGIPASEWEKLPADKKALYEAGIYLADLGRLGDNVGGSGLAWNQPAKRTYFTFGYPQGAHPDGDTPFSGRTMKYCYGTSKAMPAAAKFNVQEHIGIKCPMTGGASGGPWLMNYDQKKRVGYINGVNSLAWDTDGNGRYDHNSSPYFDGETAAVYSYAANLWTPAIAKELGGRGPSIGTK
ncbi:trypsin-like serine peptidase [Bailinhaonella thermotolerans]|uniref:Serine protease n=1 Tax=Bailinhaonella thermotolerans TaxID=1070861 RepID=A0A3A4AE61_9ACTN|nr:serine protease [Bailinhaonella thermotolerans]RJL26589.1 serine protease [Bailinhaonella thermotolerans]